MTSGLSPIARGIALQHPLACRYERSGHRPRPQRRPSSTRTTSSTRSGVSAPWGSSRLGGSSGRRSGHATSRVLEGHISVVYSMTRCERRRYRELSLETPLVPWGCHPELERFRAVRAQQDTVTYYFPGGYLSRRKPLVEVVNAFVRADDPRLRLLVKTQGVQQGLPPAIETIGALPRVTVIDGDLPTEEHHALMGSADVCLAPSRWEGLGLHLYEATGMGLPIITNDHLRSTRWSTTATTDCWSTPSRWSWPLGCPRERSDPRSLADAIRRLAEPDLRRRLADGAARASTGRLSWQHTIDGLRRLLEGA